jgi:sugar phosphate isomerase/epimerase
LAAHVRGLGFDLIELPVRPGFPVEPEEIEQGLPRAVRQLAADGVEVLNVTVDLPLDDERLYAACAEANISMNRIMFPRRGRAYGETARDARHALDRAVPLCEQYGVQLGIQHHSRDFVPINSSGLQLLIQDYDPRYVGAIWDPAHNGLQGEDPQAGLEIVQSHLCMVNLKNAFWQRSNGPEALQAQWQPYFTTGPHGLSSWRAVVAALRAVDYRGAITFSAEYTDQANVDAYIVQDLAYAKALFAELNSAQTAGSRRD